MLSFEKSLSLKIRNKIQLMIKNNSKSISTLITAMLFVGFSQTQESVNASGGKAMGSGGTVSYSVGQIVYTTASSSSGNVAQGIQQAYEISVVGIKETELAISLTVFPNPTTDKLSLQIAEFEHEELSFQLMDSEGKQLLQGNLVSSQTEIPMETFKPGVYFVNILNSKNSKIQVFKIVKN